MELTRAPASAFDMLETLAPNGGRARVTRQRFGEMARQVAEGVAVTVREPGGRLVCVIGLWPEPDHAEAWLAVGPGFREHLRAGLRATRETLEAIAAEGGCDRVLTYVREPSGGGDRPGRVAGARMAAWLGFRRIGTEDTRLGSVAVFSREFGGAQAHGR